MLVALRRVFAAAVAIASVSPCWATEADLLAPEDLREVLSQSALSLQVVGDENSGPADILAAARADYARLIGALYAAGYYGPVIRIEADGRDVANLSPFARIGKIDRLTILVEPGRKFLFGRADVAPLAAGTVLPTEFALGQPAKSGAISAAARAAVEGWRQAGHAKAKVAGQRIVANHGDATLLADIAINAGPALTFGKTVVRGKTAVKAHRIAQIAGLPEGALFSPAQVRQSAERLRRTGAFRSVELTEGAANSDNTMDMFVQVADEKPRRFGIGAEISSFDGAALSGFWMHRNSFGGAERFRLEGGISGLGGLSGGEDYTLAGTLTRPATFAADTNLSVSASVGRLAEPGFDQLSVQAGAGLDHTFSPRLSAFVGADLVWADTRDDLGDRTLFHLLLPTELVWDSQGGAAAPRTFEFFASATATPLLEIDTGNTGVRLFTDLRLYNRLGNSNTVLALRSQIGAVIADETADVPADMLFFSGGGGSVRGQPYQSLSAGGDIGGRSFLGLSAEIRLPITGNIGVVGFYDTGFVAAGDSFADGQWHAGAGAGLRYETGLGPLRLDIGVPVGGTTGKGAQFYAGIGQAF